MHHMALVVLGRLGNSRQSEICFSFCSDSLSDCLQPVTCGKSYKFFLPTLSGTFPGPRASLFPAPAPVTSPVSDQTVASSYKRGG